MPSSILDTLVKRARQAFLALREKAPVTIDESVLEHMLLYHGLIGSGPENQREFRDVRADIIAAINRQSPITLAIALKLPPLWWEDKLKSIFAELYGETKAVAVRLITQLLTASADQYQDQGISSISKGDWRIRANAAILLALLGIDKADTV